MAVSIYTTEELRLISSLPAKEVERKLTGSSVKKALLLRRNLQISLASYSTKNRSKDGKLDRVQGGILWICGQIEMRAREAFMRHYFARLWPSAKTKGLSKLSLKLKLKKQWEDLVKRTGY